MSEDSEKILSESLHAMAQDIKERDAEIAQLRHELDNCLYLPTHNAIVNNLNAAWSAELDALRTEYRAATDELVRYVDRLRAAIKRHRTDMWGEDGMIRHPIDVELYRSLE
jgi:hypothetical protein